MVTPIVMSVMLLVALSSFSYLIVPRLRLLTVLRPENLFDQIPERVRGTLKFAIGQWRMPRDPVAGIAHIFSTPTTRTRQTAQPLAERHGLKVALYDPRTPQALVAKVKGLHGPVLVVGHSNTLSELVRLFGGQPGAEIADNEYDRVYQLTPGANGGVGTVVFTSLPETGAAP